MRFSYADLRSPKSRLANSCLILRSATAWTPDSLLQRERAVRLVGQIEEISRDTLGPITEYAAACPPYADRRRRGDIF